METSKIQEFVTGELQRQNQIANRTKVACESKLQELQNVLEQVFVLSLIYLPMLCCEGHTAHMHKYVLSRAYCLIFIYEGQQVHAPI